MSWCNPILSKLISETIGENWITHLSELQKLAPFAHDKEFQHAWRAAKRTNKEYLAALVEKRCGVSFSADAMFDIQVKRIHEYKRQLLNVLHVIHLYDQIKRGETEGRSEERRVGKECRS